MGDVSEDMSLGWKRKDFEANQSWLLKFAEEELTILGDIARSVNSSANHTDSIIDLKAVENGFEALKPTSFAHRWVEAVEKNDLLGSGLLIAQRLPVHLWEREVSFIAYLLLGRLIGNLRPQNKMGHVLGHITDLGLSSDNPNVRVYQTCERQTFHTDSADIAALLCLQKAAHGGVSSVVSTYAIYHEAKRLRPDLLARLLQPFATDRRGEVPPGQLPYTMSPVLMVHDNKITGVYQRQYIDSAQRFPCAPRLSAFDIEALDFFDALCNDPAMQFTMQLEPGDIQIIHNHTTLHDRSAFTDNADHKRHLLRLWIAPEQHAHPLPPYFSSVGSNVPGQRGGINVADDIEWNAPWSP